MRRWSLALTLFSLAGVAHAQNRVPACVTVEALPRWGADAYNHYVRVENRCARAVRCQVATDVAPAPVPLRVAAGASEEVITFRGSPASTFTPRVQCAEE